MRWKTDRLVTYWGVFGVPDVLAQHGVFTPRAHIARVQCLENEATEELRRSILTQRRIKQDFLKKRGVL
jgi:hypothetical protein